MHLEQDSEQNPGLLVQLPGLSLSKSGVRVSKLVSMGCRSAKEMCRRPVHHLKEDWKQVGASGTGEPASGCRVCDGYVGIWSGTQPRRRLWVVWDRSKGKGKI